MTPGNIPELAAHSQPTQGLPQFQDGCNGVNLVSALYSPSFLRRTALKLRQARIVGSNYFHDSSNLKQTDNNGNKKKENLKLIKDLQSLLLSNKKADEKALKSIGIDTTLKTQEYRNVKITNDFWNGLSVSVVDGQKDLDGNPISENKKLILRAKNLLENGTKKIKTSELVDLNIWNPAKDIILGNIRLKNYSDFILTHDYYEIQIIDEKKNIDGLWLDSVISADRVLDVLHKFDLTASDLAKMKELDLNKELEIHFKKYFETIKKGGRSNQGDIDLIIGSNHNYGIELKLAKELSKASSSQKAIGQIELYTRQFKGNFMLIVAGLPTEKNDKSVSEVVRKAKDCKCSYYYLEAH